MFWSKGIEFSPEDCRQYLELALPQLVKANGERLYVLDGPSLVSESYVRDSVVSVLNSASGTLDTTAIATQLRVPRSAIEDVLKSAVSQTGAFSDGVHILPVHALQAIAESLTDITKIGDICASKRITIKAAEHIVRTNSDKLALVGDKVVPQDLLAKHLAAFKQALENAEEPVEYTAIEPDAEILGLIKAKLGLRAFETRYVPESYTQRKTDESAAILRSQGYIAKAEIPDVVEPLKFAKRHASVLLGPWVVQTAFIDAKSDEIQAALRDHLYYDLRDLPLAPELSKHIALDAKFAKLHTAKYPSHYLVKPQLEKEALARVSTELCKSVPDLVNQVDLDVNGSSVLAEFADRVELPTLNAVQELVETPRDLKVAQTIWPAVRQAFKKKVSEMLEPLFEKAQLRSEARIVVYLNGVLSLAGDESLVTPAFEEWQQYVSENQYNVPSSLEIAKSQFRTNVYVSETRDSLLDQLRRKLEKLVKNKKNGALVLHLAAVIYHATHFCPDGLLKIRGKLLPKLLKKYDFPQSFTELKSAVNSPSPDLLETVYNDTKS